MYLITYQQWTGGSNIMANALIKMHPYDWLVGSINKSPEANTVLISFAELTQIDVAITVS